MKVYFGELFEIRKGILENFRTYKQRVSVDINEITALIEKNDSKSTILEALETFNNSLAKREHDDLSVFLKIK